MITVLIISIMILAYYITGKDVKPLVDKLKDTDWKEMFNSAMERIKPYAMKGGRIVARPLLQFYYVMKDPGTSTMDKALIYAAIIYTVSPVDFIPAAVHNLLGILDDGVTMLYVYKKIQKKITPEINLKVDETLDEWFGEVVYIE